MHILKIIHGYPPLYNAGSEVYSQSICNELSKKHQVTVFTREENPYEPDFKIRTEKRNKNLTLYIINKRIDKDNYRNEKIDKIFAQIANKIKPDIAHIGHLNHLSTGIVDVLNKLNIPIVFTLHDFWLMCPRGQFLQRNYGQDNFYQLCDKQEDEKCALNCYNHYFSGRKEDFERDKKFWTSWIHTRMQETKSIIDKVDIFIAPSKYLMNRFINDFNVPKSKIIYLDYGFPLHYLRPVEHKKTKVYTFGYIGTHIPSKGINLLIKAFSKIEKKAVLKIWGRTNGQSTAVLKKLAQKSKNKIEFCGEYINQNLATEVFSKVDCIVVPSIWAENSPLVIHEAQACKISVITADFGGMKEYVEHQKNGLLFKHRNEDDLLQKMLFAIEHSDKMREYGKVGYLYSKTGEVPNITEHCNELEKIYKLGIRNEKLKKYSTFPTSHFTLKRITLDTNPEDCNFHCIMCEEHSQYSDFKQKLFEKTGIRRRLMPKEWLEPLFKEAKELGVKEIIPSTMGEPLLYEHFETILELCKKYNIKLNLTTNGSFPRKTAEQWARLIVPITSDIKISWNGATKETYEKIMQGSNFQKQLQNVKTLINFRNEYYEQTGYYCRITFQLTFMQNNMNELVEIVHLASKLGIDRIKGHHLWTHFKEIESLSFKQSKKSIEKWNKIVEKALEAQEKYRKPNGEKIIFENIYPLDFEEDKEVPEEYECPFLTKELWISATGKISPCCAPDELRDSLGDFGTYPKTKLKDVLTSDIYLDLCENYKQKPLCKTCNMRVPI